jgi:16S rRNA (guanine966-N2)-methyltransferase
VRIIAGRWAGHVLTSPGGRVRPTAENIRELCLALVRAELDGARVLDLFAGTGALGLEALSRGAGSCDFVENGPAALHSLKANVAALRVRDRTRIFDRDAIPFVRRLDAGVYDIAFADPPYGSQKLDRVVERWREAAFARVLCLEHAPDHVLPLKGLTRRIEETAVTILGSRA